MSLALLFISTFATQRETVVLNTELSVSHCSVQFTVVPNANYKPLLLLTLAGRVGHILDEKELSHSITHVFSGILPKLQLFLGVSTLG